MLSDRRIIKLRNTSGAMIIVLCGGGSFLFSIVCKITRTSARGGEWTNVIHQSNDGSKLSMKSMEDIVSTPKIRHLVCCTCKKPGNDCQNVIMLEIKILIKQTGVNTKN